jgi:hypothetical protein
LRKYNWRSGMSNPPERRVTLGSAPQEWLADHSFKFADYSFFDICYRHEPRNHEAALARRVAVASRTGHGGELLRQA